MALTTEEKNDIVQEAVNRITTQSTSIDELSTVEDLSQTESLPAYKKGTTDLVMVPISLISKPADEAAAKANSAASSADSAAKLATNATTDAQAATNEANEATASAKDATAAVNQALTTINTIRDTANNADTLSKQLEEQLNKMTLVTTTEEEYESLEEKDDNTLYFCVESE